MVTAAIVRTPDDGSSEEEEAVSRQVYVATYHTPSAGKGPEGGGRSGRGSGGGGVGGGGGLVPWSGVQRRVAAGGVVGCQTQHVSA